ncbi:MAG: hypothetical protein MR386_07095, partial [Prevotella sp.]|nr:hypothetical protein [Prevotella sp.]
LEDSTLRMLFGRRSMCKQVLQTTKRISMVMNRIPQKILFPLGGDWNKKRRAINALLHFL